MRAAIYARKSTDQSGVGEDAKSVTRQVAHARAFAESQGWTVAEAHVFVDDGISGAVFGAGRPGLLRLLNALSPSAPFQVLVMSEESRLGREMHQTAHVFGEIIRAGVQVWFYLDGRERKLETAIDKMMLSLTTFAAELEREKARQRTRDAMVRKAKAGHVTGGRVFGYDNVRLADHVERRVNEAEAAVVRRIYELAATGAGLKGIAHILNADGAPSPRAQRGRPSGWAPSSVREVLHRPLYRGIIEWDVQRRNGARQQLKRDRNQAPIRIEAEHLRLIPPTLAALVDTRQRESRARYLDTTGQLRGGATPRRVKYLLAGLLHCSCGATFEAIGADYGKRRRGVYVCSAYRRKGPSICGNDTHLPIADTDQAILATVERDLLDASLIEDALTKALSRIVDEGATQQHHDERDRLMREIRRLTQAVAQGGDIPSLLQELRARETRKAELDEILGRPPVDAAALRAELAARLTDWSGMLRAQPAEGQRLLRAVLSGPIRVGRPGPEGLVPWSAEGLLGELIGTLCNRVTSPPGTALVAPSRISLSGLLNAA